MTVEGLISNLTNFADFYEQASADIEHAELFQKLHARGTRDANADYYQREFWATTGIERVRAYVLAQYGEELTIRTARHVLGDLIRVHKLSVQTAGGLHLEAAMDRLEANNRTERSEGGTQPIARPPSRADLERRGEIRVDSANSLRTLEQLLHAFGKAAVRFSNTGVRVAAFRNAARGDGLTTIPASLIPKNAEGQPVVGQINLGGTGKVTVAGVVTYYGVGVARLTSVGAEMNVGFVIYGQSPDDAAVAQFRGLGSEAGVLCHLHGSGTEIQRYDNPLTVWAIIVYKTLFGSEWLSEMDMVSETLSHQFNPFTASMEVLKRLIAPPKTSPDVAVPARDSAEPATPPGAGTGQEAKSPADRFAQLRRFARSNLKGQERAVIEALCDAAGELPLADLAVTDGVGWDDPKTGFKSAQRRLNIKLSREGWNLTRHDNAAKLLAVKARKRR